MRRITFGWSNWPIRDASERKSFWFFSLEPGWNGEKGTFQRNGAFVIAKLTFFYDNGFMNLAIRGGIRNKHDLRRRNNERKASRVSEKQVELVWLNDLSHTEWSTSYQSNAWRDWPSRLSQQPLLCLHETLIFLCRHPQTPLQKKTPLITNSYLKNICMTAAQKLNMMTCRYQYILKSKYHLSICATANLPLPWLNYNQLMTNKSSSWVNGGVGAQLVRS